MLPDIRAIPLASIDQEDVTYRISTSSDPDALVPTMQRIGVLHPPILIPHPHKKRFRIVSGFARIAAACRLNWTEISGRILPEETSARTCAEFAVVGNCTCPPLNSVEQGRCLTLLAGSGHDLSELVDRANALGLKVNARMAATLLMVPRMHPVLQEGLINQSISLPVALRIHDMAEGNAIEELGGLLLELNLSLNRQRELIDWVEAISRQEDKSIHAVVNETDLVELRHDDRIDPRQKSAKIRQYLKRRRYPNIVRAEQRYYHYCRQANLPKDMELIPPPYFEGDTYCLRITFKTLEDLETAQRNIQNLACSKDLGEILTHG